MASDWQQLLKNSITSPDYIGDCFGLDKRELKKVTDKYPMRINAYYFNLVKQQVNGAAFLQAVPDIRELDDNEGFVDPLNEEGDSVVPNVTHRYPDRILFLISGECAMYCRFCTRKRKVGQTNTVTDESIHAGLQYIKEHGEIRDVILSGGDPLLLSDVRLESIIKEVRAIDHVEIIRIGTRVPCTLPQRITPELCNILRKYHPLYVNTHFNHVSEITPEAEHALSMLADAGIPLGNQTVLLAGVNDDSMTMGVLFKKLLACRVKPYYLFLADAVKGTAHFRTPVDTGLNIIKDLRGWISGMAIPTFVVDTVGGGGKVPLHPETLLETGEDSFLVSNYKGEIISCPQPPKNPRCLCCPGLELFHS